MLAAATMLAQLETPQIALGDYVVALVATGIVLLVVCWPARRQ
jgi:hypothetical protein